MGSCSCNSQASLLSPPFIKCLDESPCRVYVTLRDQRVGGRDKQLCLGSRATEGPAPETRLSCGLFCVSGAGRENQRGGQSAGLQPCAHHRGEEAEPVVRDPLSHGREKSKPPGQGLSLIYFLLFIILRNRGHVSPRANPGCSVCRGCLMVKVRVRHGSPVLGKETPGSVRHNL